MSYGVIEFDKNGKPLCEICRKGFVRVMTHVRQKHGIDARSYKKIFGFDVTKGICSKKSSELSRKNALANYGKVVTQNLIHKGVSNRFKKGDPGRTKDKMSEQTRIRLIARLGTPEMKEAMRKSGERLGKLGIGGKIRWERYRNNQSK